MARLGLVIVEETEPKKGLWTETDVYTQHKSRWGTEQVTPLYVWP